MRITLEALFVLALAFCVDGYGGNIGLGLSPASFGGHANGGSGGISNGGLGNNVGGPGATISGSGIPALGKLIAGRVDQGEELKSEYRGSIEPGFSLGAGSGSAGHGGISSDSGLIQHGNGGSAVVDSSLGSLTFGRQNGGSSGYEANVHSGGDINGRQIEGDNVGKSDIGTSGLLGGFAQGGNGGSSGASYGRNANGGRVIIDGGQGGTDEIGASGPMAGFSLGGNGRSSGTGYRGNVNRGANVNLNQGIKDETGATSGSGGFGGLILKGSSGGQFNENVSGNDEKHQISGSGPLGSLAVSESGNENGGGKEEGIGGIGLSGPLGGFSLGGNGNSGSSGATYGGGINGGGTGESNGKGKDHNSGSIIFGIDRDGNDESGKLEIGGRNSDNHGSILSKGDSGVNSEFMAPIPLGGLSIGGGGGTNDGSYGGDKEGVQGYGGGIKGGFGLG